MYISKNRIIIALLIWIIVILFVPFFLKLSFLVKLVGENYISACEDLQTDVIRYLYKRVEITPQESKVICRRGKIWNQVTFELVLPYKVEIEFIINDLEKEFGLTYKSQEEDKYSSKYYLYYNDLPVQVLKIYSQHPKVAIIFDDVGENIKQVKEILKLDIPVTVAILPFLNYSKKSAELANKNNIEVMLHLPLEPHHTKVTPGVHTITSSMSDDEITKWVKKSIQNIPHLKGANNHMGSKATEDKRVMGIVLDLFKSMNLYFIDSRTSSKSVGFKMAGKKGIPTDINRCYLDNKNSKYYINKRLDLLIESALERGDAIAIGHSRDNTIEAIKDYIPKFKSKGIKFVHVSDILKMSR